jgi:hypothetical protein
MKAIDYNKLFSYNPTKLGEMTNSIEQLVEFYEDPILGDSSPVIAINQSKLAAVITDFYDLDDMCNTNHNEYEIWWDENNIAHCGHQ